MGLHRFTAATPVQFVRKVAIDYVRFGYWRYKVLEIPEGKDLEAVDRKLIACYDITTCGTRRSRQRQQGLANVIFVRHERCFVIMATEGSHPNFNKLTTYDIRTQPLHFSHYSIGVWQGKPYVRVRTAVWREVERKLTRKALHSAQGLESTLARLPYANFPGVVLQKRQLVTHLNVQRKRAGLPLITGHIQQPSRTRKFST